jgi:UDP-N-acetylglucosamine 2-epimerase (non-hydrolysing)
MLRRPFVKHWLSFASSALTSFLQHSMKKILIIVGTRPEAIKIAPLYHELKKDPNLDVLVGCTGQHKELIYQALDFFHITPDFDLQLMTANQTLNTLLAKVIEGIDRSLTEIKPDYILVQCDTTTVFGAAIAAFHQKVKVIHLEAGLRSFDKFSPFPEEMNRLLTSSIADIHLAPTSTSADNLHKEGITRGVHVVGNTVIDALFLGLQNIEKSEIKQEIAAYFSFLDPNKRTVLLTCHRRENFGEALLEIVSAIRSLAIEFKDELQFCFPVHPNPNVKNVVHEHLADLPNVHLIEPLSYPYLIWLMSQSHFILTDSGGIQEEAPSLKKPVLVLREVTERTEGIEQGNAVLLGSDKEAIIANARRLMTDTAFYQSFSANPNPYGNGDACALIRQLLMHEGA